MSDKLKVLLFCMFVGINYSNGQQYNLEECIKRAIDANINIKSSYLSVKTGENNLKLANSARYPDLNANTNIGWNFGRSVDPTSNAFINQTFFNNGFGLSSNIAIYNGGRIKNNINQAKINLLASKSDQDKMINDISLQVASAYLNVLLSAENVANAQQQLTLTKSQQTLLERQIAVGNRPQNDIMDIEAQIALNEQSIADAQNALNLAKLTLKQLMVVSPDSEINVEIPSDIGIPTLDLVNLTAMDIYNKATNRMPEIKSAEIRLDAARIGEKIAKAELLPTLGAGVSARTNYSNKGISVTGYENVIENSTVYINSQPVDVGFPGRVPIIENTPYGNQINENLSYGVGVQLNVPIYNNYSGKAAIQRAKISTESSQYELELQKQTLLNSISQALADARAAKARYLATDKTVKANENLYNNGLKRLEIGALNTFELTRLKSQWDSSLINAINAKYEYIFRTKVLEFYMGLPINLK